jgi:hypothetical protein
MVTFPYLAFFRFLYGTNFQLYGLNGIVRQVISLLPFSVQYNIKKFL